VQEKLQEAMATDQDLQDGLAGIDIRDDEDMDIDRQKLAKKMQDDLSSIASSANAMAIEEAREVVRKLKQEMYLAEQMRESERKAAAAAASRVVSPNQLLHTRIRNDPVVVAAFNTMNTLDYCTVWWVTQFGIECIARREASATDAQKAEFKSYKNFVTRNKKKAEAGFLHIRVTPFSTPNRAPAAAAAAAAEEEEEEFE
jgi:hypothetical protein